MSPEQKVQKAIRDYCKKHGWDTHKTVGMVENGFPDLIIITGEYPDGKVHFCEVKKEGGTVSKLQERTINNMCKRGIHAFVAWSLEDFIFNMKHY